VITRSIMRWCFRVYVCALGVSPGLAFQAGQKQGGAGLLQSRQLAVPAAETSDQDLVVVFGRPDGTAANLVHSLAAQNDFAVRACFHEDLFTPAVSASQLPTGCTAGPPIDLASAGNGDVLSRALAGACHVVVAADSGGGAGGSGASEAWLQSLGRALGNGERSVVVVCPADSANAFVEAGASAEDGESADPGAAPDDDGLLSGAALGESFSMPRLPKLPDFGSVLAGAGDAVAEAAAGLGGDGGARDSDGGSGSAFGEAPSQQRASFANLKGGYGSLASAVSRGLSGKRAASASLTLVKHGRVFGGTPGNEPLPFVGGALRVPLVDEHFATRAIILSASDAILSTKDTNPLGKVQVRTNRKSLADLVTRLLAKKQAQPAEALPPLVTVLSLDGVEPSEGEWGAQFRRFESRQASNRGVELLSIEFESVPKPSALEQWLSFDWGPTMLSTISTYTKRFGARPVVASPVKKQLSSSGAGVGEDPDLVCAVRVRWEDLNDDDEVDEQGKDANGLALRMQSKLVGCLVVSLRRSASSASDGGGGDNEAGLGDAYVLSVAREGATPGSRLLRELPAEEEVLQRLLEGLEKTVYANGLATRPGTKAKLLSLEAAENMAQDATARAAAAQQQQQKASAAAAAAAAATGGSSASDQQRLALVQEEDTSGAAANQRAVAAEPLLEDEDNSASEAGNKPRRKKRPRM